MSKKNEFIIAGLLLLMLMGAFALFSVKEVNANPSSLIQPKTSAVATTSLASMSFGLGTSTMSYDTYTTYDGTKSDSALLFFIANATSTIAAPIVNARFEYAIDLYNGVNCATSQTMCDWYPMSAPVSVAASSTDMTGRFADYSFKLSTSTISDFGGSSTFLQDATTTFYQTLQLSNLPSRFIRVKFYVPTGGGKLGLWYGIQAVKQQR